MVLWPCSVVSLSILLRRRRRRDVRQQGLVRPLLLLLVSVLILLKVSVVVMLVAAGPSPTIEQQHKAQMVELATNAKRNATASFQFQLERKAAKEGNLQQQQPLASAPQPQASVANSPLAKATNNNGPYHNWELFKLDYEEMSSNLKIFVYPDVANKSSSFASVFLPHPNPYDPKLGNYFSEHAFKLALLGSKLITPHPEEAHFFFMPFSINAMRNHPLIRSESSISDFVASYTARISSQFKFWNASGGADHFFVSCHSVGREAASKHFQLHNNAIQVTCSSSYFHRLYIAHKDIGLPQVWPRPRAQRHQDLSPPEARSKLVFFAGRIQNSHIRQGLLALWGNDTSMDILSGNLSFPYEEGFRRSKYCLHVKGYEVNTARISDAIYYGCIPVLISNHYDLPFSNVLNWSTFSIIIDPRDMMFLKRILLSISRQMYLNMYQNLRTVRRHFLWHIRPKSYDAFYMTAYQLWLRRGLHHLS